MHTSKLNIKYWNNECNMHISAYAMFFTKNAILCWPSYCTSTRLFLTAVCSYLMTEEIRLMTEYLTTQLACKFCYLYHVPFASIVICSGSKFSRHGHICNLSWTASFWTRLCVHRHLLVSCWLVGCYKLWLRFRIMWNMPRRSWNSIWYLHTETMQRHLATWL